MTETIRNPGFRDRLSELVGQEEPFAWAKRVGIPGGTFARIWGEGTIPKADHLARIVKATDVDLNWLVLGQPRRAGSPFPAIPRYDARLGGGAGSLNDRAALLDHIPFTEEFLRKKLGRTSIDGLAMLEVRGDSMEPTIGDGDLVLVDQTQREPEDGIMAIVMDDFAYVKRIRHFFDGLEIISDNRDLYPPIQLGRDRLTDLHIIGRVRWCGRVFGR